MARTDFDLPHGPPTVRAGIETIVYLKVNGEPDELWCELFSQGAEIAPPEHDDVAEAVLSVDADRTGLVTVLLRPRLPDGVIVRALDWLRKLAAAASGRREALDQDAQRVQQLVRRWSDAQI